MGSGNELEYFLLLSRDLKYVQLDEYANLLGELQEVKRMLAGLLSRLRSDRMGLGA